MPNTRYSLAPGMEVVRLGDDRFQVRSDFAALELSGDTAAEVAEKVFPSLRQPLTIDEITTLLPGYRPDSVRAHLDALVREGVLVRDQGSGSNGNNRTFAALLDEMGYGADDTQATLAACKVAIFGLEAHGAHVAAILADAGVGHFVLADPFAFEPAHHTLTAIKDPRAVGASREIATARLIARPGLEITTAGQASFDRDRVRALCDGCKLLIVGWDRGFNAAHHWVNEAAIDLGVPALFSELRATTAFAGPLFIPGRSACWMCYRMRALACETDFDLAMAYEEHLDRKRQPSLAERPVLPGLPPQLGSTLALEALKFLIRLNQPTLVDKVTAFDGLSGETRTHPVLVKPFCPACSKKKRREHPSAEALLTTIPPAARPLPELVEQLVSEHTGIVVHFAAASRDATEPPLPLVWRARLSNHRYLSSVEESHLACSGKGFTRDAAWTSCLGEALERYSGGCWDAEETVLCRRSDLEGDSLHPADLVLYRPEQYAHLQYAPYGEETKLRWVRGRSLIRENDVWVPAIAAFMEYQVHDPREFLMPITSNGLAGGPTLAEAVLSAMYEVIERDAFLIAWLNRLPARRYDAASHPDADVRHLAESYRRRGVRLALYQMPVDHPVAVFAAIAFQSDGYGGPYATVGLGANLDASLAARAAALEVGQVRPAFRERCRTHDASRIAELVADPTKVKTLEDHALLYADPSMSHAFDFLDGPVSSWPETRLMDTAAALSVLLDHFRAAGQDVVYVNLTSPDLEPLGVYAARAIIPGFQPIWFGHHEPRLALPRAFELPSRLGLRAAPADLASLNPLPHPIA